MTFIFSTDVFSSAHTGTLLGAVLGWLGISVSNVEAMNLALRKAAHFGNYAVLSGLLFRAWRVTLPRRYVVTAEEGRSGRTLKAWAEPLWTLRWSGLTIVVAIAAASLDEFHQSFVPSRGASPWDVVLDAGGALFVQLCLMLAWRGKARPVKP